LPHQYSSQYQPWSQDAHLDDDQYTKYGEVHYYDLEHDEDEHPWNLQDHEEPFTKPTNTPPHIHQILHPIIPTLPTEITIPNIQPHTPKTLEGRITDLSTGINKTSNPTPTTITTHHKTTTTTSISIPSTKL
jgi:hypothetical protein